MFVNLNSLSWADVRDMNRKKLAYVLPVSSTEQHGRHLPLGTDDLILQTALDRLQETEQFRNIYLRLPALHYGNSFEHLDFPGTCLLYTSRCV